MRGLLISLLCSMMISGMVSAGDTYDCINSKGDYINYGPPKPPDHLFSDRIVGAFDSRRTDRWLPMLSPSEEKALIFLQARYAPSTINIYDARHP